MDKKWKNALLKAAGEPVDDSQEENEEEEIGLIDDGSIPEDLLILNERLAKFPIATTRFKQDNKTFKSMFEKTIKRKKGWVVDGIVKKEIREMLSEYKKEASLIYMMRNILEPLTFYCHSENSNLELSSTYKAPKYANYPKASRIVEDSFRFTEDFNEVMYAFNLREKDKRDKKSFIFKEDFLLIFVRFIESNKYEIKIIINLQPIIGFDSTEYLDINEPFIYWKGATFNEFADTLNLKVRHAYIFQKSKSPVKKEKMKDPNELYLEDIWN